METLTIDSESTCTKVLFKIRRAFEKDRYLSVKIYSGRRTLSQNALVNVFYVKAAKEKEWAADYTQNYCKHRFGLPILRLDPECDLLFEGLDKIFPSMSYEEQVNYMEFIAVTSIMSVRQLKQYIEDMQLHFGEYGIVLESNKPKR